MQNNLFVLFTEPFRQAEIEYFITGSVAAIVYGEPRFTNDIDVVVNIRSADIVRLERVFPPDLYHLPPSDIIQTEINRPHRGHFSIIHKETMFMCDVYTAGDDPSHKWAFANTRTIDFLNTSIIIAPPEYVIIRKLEFYQEGGSTQHLSDIPSILTHSADQIDCSFLKSQILSRNLSIPWLRVNNSPHTKV